MARARNIKPGLFKNEVLVERSLFVRLLFIGLWTLADREGRLEDRPKRIKMELFPCDSEDVELGLEDLAEHGFIHRYTANGMNVIQIINFAKHQSPHGTEKDSELPDANGCLTVHERNKNGHVTGTKRTNNVKTESDNVHAPLCNGEITVKEPPDSLIHRFTDSPNPDSLIPDSPKEKPSRVASLAPAELELQDACRKTWEAYSTEFHDRYGTDPVRNAKVSSCVKQFVKRIGYTESPLVAAFYVLHNDAYYIKKGHDFGSLLSDAEKVRMEWATNRTVTGIKARQLERSSSTYDAVAEIMQERAQA